MLPPRFGGRRRSSAFRGRPPGPLARLTVEVFVAGTTAATRAISKFCGAWFCLMSGRNIKLLARTLESKSPKSSNTENWTTAHPGTLFSEAPSRAPYLLFFIATAGSLCYGKRMSRRKSIHSSRRPRRRRRSRRRSRRRRSSCCCLRRRRRRRSRTSSRSRSRSRSSK